MLELDTAMRPGNPRNHSYVEALVADPPVRGAVPKRQYPPYIPVINNHASDVDDKVRTAVFILGPSHDNYDNVEIISKLFQVTMVAHPLF